MSTTIAVPIQRRSTIGYKIFLFLGLILVPIGIYLLIYQSYESETTFHPTETRYGIKCVNLWFKSTNTGYQPTASLLLTDKGSSPTFEKFRKDLSSGNVYLGLQQSNGVNKTLNAEANFELGSAKRPNIPVANVAVDFESTTWGNISGADLYLYFSDFAPVKLEPTNPVLRYMPFLSGFTPVFLIALGGIFVLISGVVLYDSTPIPDEFIPAPEPLYLTTDEPWRKRTNFRYLEKLKENLLPFEDLVKDAHKDAVEAHQRLPNSNGYLAYKQLRSTIKSATRNTESYLEEISKMKEHIEMVFSGDVRTDLREFEEKKEKFKRENWDYNTNLREVEKKIANTNDKDSIRGLEATKSYLSHYLKSNDMRIIEIESIIKELREFDFHKLYEELGVSPEVMRTRLDDLKKVKEKKDAAGRIHPPQKQSDEGIRAMKKAEIEEKIKILEKEIEEIYKKHYVRSSDQIQEINIREDKLHNLRKERLNYL